MFTWICPKCGSEVGPSFSECPNCAPASAAQTPATPPPPVAAPAPPQPQYPPAPQYPPPAPPPPPPPAAPPPPQTYVIGAEPEKRRLPGWLAAILAFAAVGAAAYGIVTFLSGNRSAAPAKSAQKAAPTANPYARYLELTGFRINEAKGKKLQVQFLAVNHGGADLANIRGTMTLKVKGDPNAEPACTFKFDISTIPAYGAKEVLVTEFSQRRKFFEMPDWQFLEPVVEYEASED